jgi:hypothetical protein
MRSSSSVHEPPANEQSVAPERIRYEVLSKNSLPNGSQTAE